MEDLDCSGRAGIVVDAFAGSGTTLVAAHRIGRCGYGINLEPKYCDVILKRLREETKIEPVLSPLGETFDKVAAERAAASSERLGRKHTPCYFARAIEEVAA